MMTFALAVCLWPLGAGAPGAGGGQVPVAQMVPRDGEVRIGNDSLVLLDVVLGDVDLELKSGSCAFELTEARARVLDLPVTLRPAVNRFLDRLDQIRFSVPEVFTRVGTLRLNSIHLDGMDVSLTGEHGGSLKLTMRFESAGKEILGAFHGQLDNLVIRSWFPFVIGDGGLLRSRKPIADVSADINVEGVNNRFETREQTRRDIEAATESALGSFASSRILDDLAQIISRLQSNSQLPQNFRFERVMVDDEGALLGWTQDLSRVTVKVVEVRIKRVGVHAENHETPRLTAILNGDGENSFRLQQSHGTVTTAAQVSELVATNLPFSAGLRMELSAVIGKPDPSGLRDPVIERIRALEVLSQLPAPAEWLSEVREFTTVGPRAEARYTVRVRRL